MVKQDLGFSAIKRRLLDRLHPRQDPHQRVDEPQYQLVDEPQLLPPPDLVKEHTPSLEWWFRWAEEWSVLLRVYAGLGTTSSVLDIGCGPGRVAFPLRYVITDGAYLGFDLDRRAIAFTQEHFTPAYPNFRFVLADIRNTFYNPDGVHLASEYRFPCDDAVMDVAFAASIFTHMAPENALNYFREAARALKVGGKCLFSFFILDHYQPSRARRGLFALPDFNFDWRYGDYGDRFAISHPENPELMTAYSLGLIEDFAAQAGLRVSNLLPGEWSCGFDHWIGLQDMVVLERVR
jgi:SAM-dependent methyltransferase